MLRSLREPLLEPPSSSHHRPSTFRCGLTLFAALPAFFFVALFCNRTLHPRPAESLQAQPWLEFALWESALGGNRLEEVHPYSVVPLAPPDVTLTVRPEDERQSIVGFGGAITQASGTVWRRLSPQLRQRVVELFFGASGIGASLARVPINSCDFAEASYSEDDVPDDYDLSHFDDGLAHDERLLLPLVRAALAVGGPRLQLLASPWSPPAWMKSSGAMDGNGAPVGLRPEAAAAWAAYLSRWLAAFSARGANVSWLTVQNEPLSPSPWEACFYNASQEAAFIGEHLGPALVAGAAAGRHPPVSLLGFDDQKDVIEPWADALLGAGRPAAAYTAGLAYHWYAGGHFSRLARAAAAHPGKIFLGTEATYELTRLSLDPATSHGAWVREGVWARGEGYAAAILGDLRAGSSGWIDWNLLLDATGGPNHLNNTCDAPMIASESFDAVHLHPQFFFLGHFSKFVPRGSKLVRLDGGDGGGAAAGGAAASAPSGGAYNLSDSAVAYGDCPATGQPQAAALKRPDGRLVVVVLNCNGAAKVVRIEVAGRGDDSGRRRGAVQHTIPPHAIHTWVFDLRVQRESDTSTQSEA